MSETLHAPEFWVAVAFVIFVVLAARPIMRSIGGSLDERSARIRAQLDEAERLRDEAQRLLTENQRHLREAVKEAEDIVAHARSEAERIRRDSNVALEQAFARREKMAMDKIAQAEAQALNEVRREAVDIAVAAATALLSQAVDEQRNEALVDAAIADVGRSLH